MTYRHKNMVPLEVVEHLSGFVGVNSLQHAANTAWAAYINIPRYRAKKKQRAYLVWAVYQDLVIRREASNKGK